MLRGARGGVQYIYNLTNFDNRSESDLTHFELNLTHFELNLTQSELGEFFFYSVHLDIDLSLKLVLTFY